MIKALRDCCIENAAQQRDEQILTGEIVHFARELP